jgi:ureidoglycolate hydrolase
MRLKFEELTEETFSPYGSFVNAYDVDKDNFDPIGYFPDMIEVDFLGQNISICICHIDPQPPVTSSVETHNTDECWILLDGDGVAAFGTPSKEAEDSVFKAFYIKKGTAVCMKKGVWHSAPFPVENNRLMVVTLLPPKTHEKDIFVQDLKESVEIIL